MTPMDPAAFRAVMGHFATGIAVVTTATGGRLHGITVNSLASVSLDPLLVLVCIETAARAHGEIQSAGRFGVSLLGAEQEAASRTFAARGEPESGRLRGVAYRIGPHGTPLLDGAIATLECSVVRRLDGGDHSIFLGQVLGGGVERDGEPLVYFRGAYRRLAPRPV